MIIWEFWLADNDRSTDWDLHTRGLYYVCHGVGDTPAGAWEEAKRRERVPGEFELPEQLVAIPADAGVPFEATL